MALRKEGDPVPSVDEPSLKVSVPVAVEGVTVPVKLPNSLEVRV